MNGRIKMSSFRVLVIGFALLILAGGLLLSLPISNKSGRPLGIMESLFTATSATCVTGLVLFDTYTQFTLFGQAVILILIQIGGLGFMMVAMLLSMLTGRRIGLRERSLLMDSVSVWKLGGIVRMTKHVLIGTAIFELTGAVLLSIRFCPKFGFFTGLWYGLFHSVSAFCNAGFDLMGIIKPGSSLMAFAGDPLVNITTIALIVIGGLGFFLWNDIAEKKWHFPKYRLHTKIVLIATACLIVVGTVLLYLFEADHTLKGMDTGEKIMVSLFHSVTPRTAGYNTVDMAAMSDGGAFLTMILMLVGAGPGSTAGGLKVTTLVVLLLSIVERAKRHNDLNIFGRRLESDVPSSVASSVGMYSLMCTVGIFVLCAQGFGLKESAFEVLSAIGTVGLSMGITPELSNVSRIMIIMLMYIGRVGSLSLAMAVTDRKDNPHIKNPAERIIIG